MSIEEPFPVTYFFSEADQISFATLSGDWNPLHHNYIDARRSIYGGITVHGMHGVFWALDIFFANNYEKECAIKKIAINFDAPILIGDLVTLRVSGGGEESEFLIEIIAREKCFTRIKLSLIEYSDYSWTGSTQIPPKFDCVELDASSIKRARGVVKLYFPSNLICDRFPKLFERLASGQIAKLLAITRIIGMECPGLHSLFSSLVANFNNSFEFIEHQYLQYETIFFDDRFSYAEMKIFDRGFSAQIFSFIRPKPVKQIKIERAMRLINKSEFSKVNALIIGGSRGLGESVAKLIAAGGGKVCITYAVGLDDAKRVAEEITGTGSYADFIHCDMLSSTIFPDNLSEFTHYFYCATPKISETKEQFDLDLFDKYCSYYVAGAMKLIQEISINSFRRVNFFYPSTIFIDGENNKYTEYVAAKIAGEAACKACSKSYPSIKFFVPRLPKIATDQTIGISGSNEPKCEDVVLPILRMMI